MTATNFDDSDEYGEGDEQDDGVSGTESVGEVIVVLRPSLRSRRDHSDDLVHDRSTSAVPTLVRQNHQDLHVSLANQVRVA